MRSSLLALQLLLLLLIPTRALSRHPLDVYWDYRFDFHGLDRAVHALYSDGQDVYVGGEFRYAGDLLVKKIARWDGTEWHALGSGVFNDGNYVADVIVHNGDVYAGGTFEEIGGVTVHRVARWDGSQWHALGGGAPAAAYALAFYDGQLHAGGPGWLSRWDGATWTDVGSPGGSGLSSVRDLAVSGPDLYVCGRFTDLGGTSVLNVARGGGSTWSPLGGGLDGSCVPTVFGLACAGSDVYAVGQYSNEAGGAALGGVGLWDGVAWSAVGSGIYRQETYMCDVPYALAVCEFNGGIVIGGFWEKMNGQDIPYLAWRLGGNWIALGSGVNGTVNAVCVHNGNLVVGGSFTQAGGKTSNRFGIWWSSNPPTAIQAPDAAPTLSQNTPNPFNPSTRFDFSMDRTATVTITVYDARGRVVRTLFSGPAPTGSHTVEWDGRDDAGASLSSGVYFYQLRSGTETVTRKAVLLK